MLRIITFNLNGIRSAYTKGFAPWLARQKAAVYTAARFSDHAPLIMDFDWDAPAH